MTDGARQITQVLGKARRALDRRAGPRVSAEVIPSARRSGILSRETHGNVIALVMHVEKSFAGVSRRCLIPRLAFTEDTVSQDITCRRSSGRATHRRQRPRSHPRDRGIRRRSRARQSRRPVADAYSCSASSNSAMMMKMTPIMVFRIQGPIAEYPAEAIDAAFSNFDWFTRRALQRLREALARTRRRRHDASSSAAASHSSTPQNANA